MRDKKNSGVVLQYQFGLTSVNVASVRCSRGDLTIARDVTVTIPERPARATRR